MQYTTGNPLGGLFLGLESAVPLLNRNTAHDAKIRQPSPKALTRHSRGMTQWPRTKQHRSKTAIAPYRPGQYPHHIFVVRNCKLPKIFNSISTHRPGQYSRRCRSIINQSSILKRNKTNKKTKKNESKKRSVTLRWSALTLRVRFETWIMLGGDGLRRLGEAS